MQIRVRVSGLGDGPIISQRSHRGLGVNSQGPLVPSVRITAYGQINQLRDPAIFEDNSDTWLLYAVAGESGIAIAGVSIA